LVEPGLGSLSVAGNFCTWQPLSWRGSDSQLPANRAFSLAAASKQLLIG